MGGKVSRLYAQKEAAHKKLVKALIEQFGEADAGNARFRKHEHNDETKHAYTVYASATNIWHNEATKGLRR